MRLLFSGLMVLFALGSTAVGYEEEGLPLGTQVPEFTIVSGEAEELLLEDVLGKVVVLFYENRDCCEVNRELKDELNYQYEGLDGWHQDEVAVVPVTDCRSSNGMTRGEWKKGLRGKSEEEGWTIYGDWDGAMLKDFNFVEGDSNFMILDRNGNVVFYSVGQIDWYATDNICELLLELVHAEDAERLPQR